MTRQLQTEIHQLIDEDPEAGSQLARIIEAWSDALGPDVPNTVVEKQAGLFADLWEWVRLPERAPATGDLQPPDQQRQVGTLWGCPRIARHGDSMHWVLGDEAYSAIAAYVEEGPEIPMLDRLLLHAAIYGRATMALYRLGMGLYAWRRPSIEGPKLARGLGWITINPSRIHGSGAGEAWHWGFLLLGAAAVFGLLVHIDWRVAAAGAILAWQLAPPFRPALHPLASREVEVAESLLHVLQLARPHDGGSAHAVRERMYATEKLGADWPPVAYRLVERLIAAGH